MGLLDSVLGGLLGNSPLQSVLTSMLAGQGGGASGGGLAGLVQQFENAGLGQVVGSWISNQPNQPISPQALGQVFNQQQLSQWASQAGMSQDGLLAELSKVLPHAVDRMTPNGEVPSSSPFDDAGIAMPGSS